uniref:Uncharacterized protein n=1 Tax=Oryza nivara TaxID=4536 RepID=A0A0E0IJ29_ORYNI
MLLWVRYSEPQDNIEEEAIEDTPCKQDGNINPDAVNGDVQRGEHVLPHQRARRVAGVELPPEAAGLEPPERPRREVGAVAGIAPAPLELAHQQRLERCSHLHPTGMSVRLRKKPQVRKKSAVVAMTTA